ncbi:hypothetical protein M501DRAFT_936910 [Patellaria atrata CBS 101060]|uniref:Uncharacterized protein n=1 Tax=Patellaria atrata CBS 101060 TaxID=1346257 RepID=A0A9P4S8G1_9PEZI|nr:hypothetical protein M501DRAFT_936910 [Patellaria atrata CBS 101060]
MPLIPYISASGSAPHSFTNQFYFPLSSDHLITIIQFNVLRGILTNMTILNLLSTLPLECGGALNLPQHPYPDSSSVLLSLLPTPLQILTQHAPWIDIFPSATVRDNLIRNQGYYDDEELCHDMVGGLYEGFDEVQRYGMVVWNDPWAAEGWGVTEGFVQEWGFLLKGAGEIIAATNRWRGLRGENELVLEYT